MLLALRCVLQHLSSGSMVLAGVGHGSSVVVVLCPGAELQGSSPAMGGVLSWGISWWKEKYKKENVIQVNLGLIFTWKHFKNWRKLLHEMMFWVENTWKSAIEGFDFFFFLFLRAHSSNAQLCFDAQAPFIFCWKVCLAVWFCFQLLCIGEKTSWMRMCNPGGSLRVCHQTHLFSTKCPWCQNTRSICHPFWAPCKLFS